MQTVSCSLRDSLHACISPGCSRVAHRERMQSASHDLSRRRHGPRIDVVFIVRLAFKEPAQQSGLCSTNLEIAVEAPQTLLFSRAKLR